MCKYGLLMSKLFLLLSFFVITPLFLVFNILFLWSNQKEQNRFLSSNLKPAQKVMYAALPTTQSISQGQIDQIDARIELVRQFFARYGSPLEPYAKDVVSKADQYGIDFRLLPAIAMQESNLCKKAPEGSYNCWGFGIYGGKVKTFDNYQYAIETVTKSLAKNYKNKGLETPEEIVNKYTPSDNGRWVYAVSHFMNQLQ